MYLRVLKLFTQVEGFEANPNESEEASHIWVATFRKVVLDREQRYT